MNLKISVIIKSIIGIILLLFGGYCFTMENEILLSIGIMSLFSSFLISPIFDFLCKKTDKKFTILQKLTLEYGMFIILYFFAIISYIKDNNYSEYIKYIIGIIIIFWGLFFMLNKRKYNHPIKVSLIKRILLIIVSVFIINLPINHLKIIYLNDSYNIINKYYNYEILESKQIYSNNNISSKSNFDKLYYNLDLDYQIKTNTKETQLYIKTNELGQTEETILIKKDIFSEFKQNKVKTTKFDEIFLKYFIEKYNINSNAKVLDYINNNKLNITDSLYDITTINYLLVIAESNNIKNFQKIQLNNDLIVYVLEKENTNIPKMYELYVNYEDYSYQITYSSNMLAVLNKDRILDFIKTLTIKK